MDERFTSLYRIPANLYTEGSPVVIVAGALLKDNRTGNILAQLKFRNISNKVIKAVKVSISEFDTVGAALEGNVTYEYLDLSVYRDDEFGQKIPVKLENNTTRSYSVEVKEVIFNDNSTWNGIGKEWSSIKEGRALNQILDDFETVKQFKLTFSNACEKEAIADRDLWVCSCGAINHTEENECHRCRCFFKELTSYDLNELNEKRDARLVKEAEEAERRAKELKKKTLIIAGVVILLFILMSACSSHNKKVERYDRAISIINGDSYYDDIEDGIDILKGLGGFRDSEEILFDKAVEMAEHGSIYGIDLLKEMEDNEAAKEALYQIALKRMETNYEASVELFEFLGDYKESKEKIGQAPYVAAENAMKKNDYASAYQLYVKAGTYKDSKKKAQQALFYDTVLSTNFYNNRISASKFAKEVGAKAVTGEELKNKILGDWYMRYYVEPTMVYTFAEGGACDLKKFSRDAWEKSEQTCVWEVVGDELSTTTKGKNYKGEDVEEVEKAAFMYHSDGLLIAYDVEDGCIDQVFIATDGKLSKELIDKYPKHEYKDVLATEEQSPETE